MSAQEEYLSLPVGDITVNDNIRKTFDEAALAELADSLKTYGMLEPILVRPLDGEWGRVYILVAGERRLRAAKMAGLKEVPCRIINIPDKQAAEVQLLENLQRADLNALEQAQALSDLIKEHGYTQEALAQKLGKSQPWVASRVRLLELPEKVKDGITRGIVSASAGEVLARYSKAAPDVITKVVEQLKDRPIPVARMREEVDLMVANRGKPLDGLQGWDKPLFDAAECIATCPKAVRLRLVGYKDERPYCSDPKCWAQKNQAAKEDAFRQAIEAAGPEAVNLDTLDYGTYTTITNREIVRDCPADCPSRRHGVRTVYGGGTECVEICLDPSCHARRRDAYWKAEQDAENAVRQARLEHYQQAVRHAGIKHVLAGLPHNVLASVAMPALLQLGWEHGIPWSVHNRDMDILRKLDAMDEADLVGLVVNTLVEKRVRHREFVELDYLLGKPLPPAQAEQEAAAGEDDEPDYDAVAEDEGFVDEGDPEPEPLELRPEP